MAVFDESVVAAMGANVRPTPKMLQLQLCIRGVHTHKKAVEKQIERRFSGDSNVWVVDGCVTYRWRRGRTTGERGRTTGGRLCDVGGGWRVGGRGESCL